jgi:hypothetical protein
VLEEDGEDRSDRSCEKSICITKSQGVNEYPEDSKKDGRIGHILHRKCLLKHVLKKGEKEGWG